MPKMDKVAGRRTEKVVTRAKPEQMATSHG